MADGTRIGVVTTTVPKRTGVDGGSVVRPALHFCRMAEHAADLGATLLLFAPGDVAWTVGRVHAWSPKTAGRPFADWEKKSFPLPHAIYENVFVHLAVKGHASALRGEARRRGIPLFNPPLPGKWAMTRWLTGTAHAKYLPPTHMLTSISEAVQRIDAWGLTYVKPIGGYGGQGVSRVEVLGRGRYRVSVDRTATQTLQKRTEMTTAQLRVWLSGLKVRPHIVQKGLHLLKLGGRKVDFRVVVQRDVTGAWHLVGIVPKMAAKDGVVTNLVAGGESLTLARCEALAKRENTKIPVDALGKASLDIARFISLKSPKAGIIGFDMGVEEDGRVYMIEMNPKPARSLLTLDMRKVAAKHAVGFSVYLARRGGKANGQ